YFFSLYLKEHLQYGGKWKRDIHGKYTPVCITNENNTSQTRVYCCNKLNHPIQGKKIKGYLRVQSKGSFRCINLRSVSVSISNRLTRNSATSFSKNIPYKWQMFLAVPNNILFK
ncbi:hypothetical protein BDF21DRAFT_480497, partial [Thamnidium elegans]